MWLIAWIVMLIVAFIMTNKKEKPVQQCHANQQLGLWYIIASTNDCYPEIIETLVLQKSYNFMTDIPRCIAICVSTIDKQHIWLLSRLPSHYVVDLNMLKLELSCNDFSPEVISRFSEQVRSRSRLKMNFILYRKGSANQQWLPGNI